VNNVEESRRGFLKASLPLTALAVMPSTSSAEVKAACGGFPINICDYGALGDGIADDAPAILAAIAAATDGSSIYIPKGNYKCMSSIVVNKEIKIFGDHHRGSRLTFNFGIDGIVVNSGLSNVTLSNLSLRSSINNQNGTSVGIKVHSPALGVGVGSGYVSIENMDVALFGIGISFRFCQISSVRACHFFFNGIGIYLKRCVSIKIIDTTSEFNNKWGMHIDGDAAAITLSCGTLITHCQFLGNGNPQTSTDSGAIYVSYNENFELVSCMIDAPALMSRFNLILNGCYRANIGNTWFGASKGPNIKLVLSHEIIMTSCNIVTAATDGVAIESSTRCIVGSCTFTQNSRYDVIVYGTNSFGNIVNGNTSTSSSISPSVIETAAFSTICTSNVLSRPVQLNINSINQNNIIY
jgi:hypothetical protein